MTPFFIIATPRARASLLVRILNASPGIRCVEDGFAMLPKLLELHRLGENAAGGTAIWPPANRPPDGWAGSLTNVVASWCGAMEGASGYGIRSSYVGKNGWKEAIDSWSRLQSVSQGTKLIFLTRDDEETEISMFATIGLWVPSFGTCHGNCLSKVREMRKAMADYHEMNPLSTVILDANDVIDYQRLKDSLVRIGIKVGEEAFQREISCVAGDRRSLAPPLVAMPPNPAAKTPARQRRFRLPLVSRPPAKGLAVYTLRYGSEAWLVECAPPLDSWARRHGLPLKVWSETNPSYPAAKFTVLDMIRDFLESQAERMLYIDADVMIHPAAPVPRMDDDGIYITADRVYGGNEKWGAWCRRRFGTRPPEHWTYRNTGVWSMDRRAAETFLAHAAAPFHVRLQEQHHFNWWLHLAAKQGVVLRDLPESFNMFPSKHLRGWFFHLAGGGKMEKLARVRKRGHLPLPPEPFAELPEPALDLAIVYPWKAGAAAWDELRYSLRSVQRHFSDKACPIFILGDEQPVWLQEHGRVRFIHAPTYLEALVTGLQLARRIVWMNDDIHLLRDVSILDLKVALSRGDARPKAGEWFNHPNAWRQGFARAVVDIIHHGAEEVLDFSTHTPYLFEREKALLTLAKFHLPRKAPFETIYHNHHRTPMEPVGVRKCSDMKCPLAWYLNFSDKTLTLELKARIRSRFPVPATWEKADEDKFPAAIDIVVLSHAGAGFPHLAPLRENHGGCPIHLSEAPAGDADEKVTAWRNNDRRIRDWWIGNRDRVNSEFVAFLEWDVLANGDLRSLVVPEAGLVGRDPKEMGDKWGWWGEVVRLPAGLREHACGIAPLAVLIMRRDCLEAIAAPEWDGVFTEDVFCEVRLPTVVRAAGFSVSGMSELAGIGVQEIEHPGELPGFWHPVKSSRPLVTR